MELIIGGSVLVAVLGLMAMVHQSNVRNDNKVNRAYIRLDEVKESNKHDFVARDVCDVKYGQVVKVLDKLEKNIDFLVRKASGE